MINIHERGPDWSEAPESVKHYSGHDPADEPPDDICPDCHNFLDECVCDEEVDELQERQDDEYIERNYNE